MFQLVNIISVPHGTTYLCLCRTFVFAGRDLPRDRRLWYFLRPIPFAIAFPFVTILRTQNTEYGAEIPTNLPFYAFLFLGANKSVQSPLYAAAQFFSILYLLSIFCGLF
jgi:hypothetical protein